MDTPKPVKKSPQVVAVHDPSSDSWLTGLARRFYGGWVAHSGILRTDTPSGPLSPEEQQLVEHISEAKLRKHVAFLGSPDLQGRNSLTAGAETARQYVVSRMQEIGLDPTFGDSFLQDYAVDGALYGTNVGGVLKANRPNPTGEYLVVMAHLDHLGVEGGAVFAGADDNASAVAAMLEIAHALKEANPPRNYDIHFIAPDNEEPPDIRTERMGSSHFVRNPPAPIDKMRLAVVFDCLGNGVFDTQDDAGATIEQRFLVVGAESSERSADLVNSFDFAPSTKPYVSSVALLEKHLILPWNRFAKSDYLNARDAKRPFIMISAGTSPRYHTPDDLPESVDHSKIKVIADYTARLLTHAAQQSGAVDFNDDAVDPLADAAALEAIYAEILVHPPAGLHPSLHRKLRANARRLAVIDAELELDPVPSPARYYEIQAAALDIQHAFTRPTASKLGLIRAQAQKWLAGLFA